jgi:CheY-like chemotaxis protein
MVRTVLVADDNPAVRKMLCRMFEAEEDGRHTKATPDEFRTLSPCLSLGWACLRRIRVVRDERSLCSRVLQPLNHLRK